jgi:hypothetical protein
MCPLAPVARVPVTCSQVTTEPDKISQVPQTVQAQVWLEMLPRALNRLPDLLTPIKMAKVGHRTVISGVW